MPEAIPDDIAAMIAADKAADLAIRAASRGGTCPQCGDLAALQRRYAAAGWLPYDDDGPRPLLTPEGEFAGYEEGRWRVADRDAATALIATVAVPSGDGFVELVDTEDGPWPRANLWFTQEGDLTLACTGDRSALYDVLFDHALPAITRSMRTRTGVDADRCPQEP